SACGKDGGDSEAGNADENSGGTGADVGDGDGDGDGDGESWAIDNIYGVTNRDDDDGNGKPDWMDPPFEGDDDLTPLTFSDEMLASMASTDTARLTLDGDLSGIRIWGSGDGAPLMGANSGSPEVTTLELSVDEMSNLSVEFIDYMVSSTLTVERVGEDGETLDSTEVIVAGSPLILNHHLQPSEHLWVVSVNFGGGSNNAAMIMDFQDVFADDFTAVAGNPYGGDVWIQDEIEFGTQVGSNGERQDVIVDSIRDRGLDNFAEDIAETVYAVDSWGVAGTGNSCDSFGNLEISPPITVDGVEYPYGRIYYGDGGVGCRVTEELRSFLDAQKVQAPFETDTSWLCVGHVDEFSTFIPDPDSEKGFKFLYADTNEAWALLEAMDPSISLPRYLDTHGHGTVGEIVNDTELRTRNDGIQANYLDPILTQYKTEFGLTDDDIILIPSLFEQCGGPGYNVALTPGTPNLIVGTDADGIKLIVPDTFVRTDDNDQAADPFIADFRARMPASYAPEDIIFTDNWRVYHANLGEVHCGTNVRRTPDTPKWWEAAAHLID
ncbi:MAG: protein-arginine deiminase family protein, partial [Nannocystaceae bacterium]